MAIGLGTALAIGAITAGTSATKAVIQSKGAKKAAEQQQKGTKEASGYQREGLNQIGQLYAPYINSGAGAMGTLGQLTTPGSRARFASPGPPNAMPQPSSPYGENPDAYRFAQPRPPMGGGGYSQGGLSPQGFRPRSPFRSGGYGPPPPMDYGSPENPIPMAKGGVVTVNRPTTFLAGEAGPERVAVKPLARPAAAPPRNTAQLQQMMAARGRPVTPPHVPGSVRANAARAAAQQAQPAPNPLPPQAQQQQALMQQQEQELRAREGAINPNSGIAGPQMVPEQYGAMGPDAGGPWGQMMGPGNWGQPPQGPPPQRMAAGPWGQMMDPRRQMAMRQMQQQRMMPPQPMESTY